MKDTDFKKWSCTREEGVLKFILKTGLLSWGIPMLIVTAILNRPFEDGYVSPSALAHYITWTLGGLSFGILLWLFNELRYKKEMSKRSRA